VTGHHGGGSPVVRHARSNAPDAITAGGVTHNVHLVRVHVQEHDGHLDNLLIETVRLGTEMQVPGVRNGTGAQVHTLGRLIEPFLVVPLLVVRRCRGTAAAMQGDIQGTATRGLIAEGLPPDGHLVLTDLQDLVLISIGQGRMDGIPPLAFQGGEVGLVGVRLGLFRFRSLFVLLPGIILGLAGVCRSQDRNQGQCNDGQVMFHLFK